MQVHTLTNMESEQRPIQIGEPFHCWECGSLDQGGMFLIIDHSPLEAYSGHIYYMRLECRHNPRCVRLGDAITPLHALDRSIDENLSSVREGLALLINALLPDQQNQEPFSKVVYLLIAGRISPQTAISQLRNLAQSNQPFLPAKLPVNEQTGR